MAYSNNNYRMCVFRSPEKYEDYNRDIIEIPDNNFLQYPVNTSNLTGPLPDTSVFRRIQLRRTRWSWHVDYQLLENFGIRLSPTHNLNMSNEEFINNNAILLTLFRKVSELTYNLLKEEEKDHPEHTIILDKVDIVKQEHTDRLLIDLIFYACNYRDAELGSRRFQETFYRVYQNSLDQTSTRNESSNTQAEVTVEELERALRQVQQIARNNDFQHLYNLYRNKTTYDKKAEDKALKLLKTILKPNEFKIYKEDGYVMVQGKSGKMYKVKKGGMIEVSRKRKNSNLYENYRLCIEPKNYGTICPTDEVIAKIKLIQADENKLHKIAKKFKDK